MVRQHPPALQKRLILGLSPGGQALLAGLERHQWIDFGGINAANQRPILVYRTTHIGAEVGARSNHVRDEHDDDAHWHRSAHDREGPSFEMSSSRFAVQRGGPRGGFAEQLHLITTIEPLYGFRNGQRHFGVAAAFAALGATKMYQVLHALIIRHRPRSSNARTPETAHLPVLQGLSYAPLMNHGKQQCNISLGSPPQLPCVCFR